MGRGARNRRREVGRIQVGKGVQTDATTGAAARTRCASRRARTVVRTGTDIALQLDRGARRRAYAQGMRLVAAHFHQREVDNNLWGSSIEIVNDLFR